MAAANEVDINKALKPHLKEIVAKKITLNEQETRENVSIMEDTMKALVSAMRKVDPLFDELFQKVKYVGSYFDGIRITTPGEFDLHMVIRMPMKPDVVLISQISNAPGFFQYKILKSITDIYALNPRWTPILYQKLLPFFDKQGHLLRSEVQRWVQGIISRTVGSKHFKLPPTVKELKPSQSGPAFTWHIITKNERQIDVDLVPVIDGSHMPMPRGIEQTAHYKKLNAEARSFFLVPRAPEGATACSDSNADYWRISFAEAEKKLISGMGCAKMIIKLFKLLRDTENWQDIKSYYMKALFLLEFEEHPNPDYWNEYNLGTLFLQMLERLKTVISQRSLQYYFVRNANLLNNISTTRATEIANRLERIITLIKKEPEKVRAIYKLT